MARVQKRQELLARIHTLEEDNSVLNGRLDAAQKVVAMQRAAMYSNSREIQRLRDQVEDGEAVYLRVYHGLLHLFKSKEKVSALRRKEGRLYYRLILHGVTSSEISRIEKEDGYNGLKRELKRIVDEELASRRAERANRSEEEQGKVDDYLKKTYRI